MNRRDFQDGSPPWSFFIPVTLAVVLGVLIADAARLAIGMVFADAAVSEAPAAAPREAVAPAAAEEAPAPPPPAGAARRTAAAPASPAPPEALQPERLPGPSAARREGQERACINGTVAIRVGNGWEQEVQEDAPARCVAASP